MEISSRQARDRGSVQFRSRVFLLRGFVLEDTIRTHREYQTHQVLSMLSNRKTLVGRYGDLVSPLTRPREFGISISSIESVDLFNAPKGSDTKR